MTRLQRWISCILIYTIFAAVYPVTVTAQTATDSVNPEKFISNGGYSVITPKGKLQYLEKKLFIPASTIKIVTSLAALELLGPDYRFETYFYIDRSRNLYIRGSGDPFLTSENILKISKQLMKSAGREFKSLYLDDSSFNLQAQVAEKANTLNPYDAPNGALAVNFNSLPIEVTDSGTILPGEAQTPFLPIMKKAAGLNLKPGFHRLNIDKVFPPAPLSSSLKYTGELITAVFAKSGIHFSRGFAKTEISKELIDRVKITPVYTYRSTKTMANMVEACLKYSNNFVANQLFLKLGLELEGEPATWQKSRKVMRSFLTSRLDLKSKQVVITEGSGLSRDNRISPEGMLRVLLGFKPYADLLQVNGRAMVKSGTLDGVYSYAGYLTQQSRLDPFVILLNQKINNRDKILNLFKKMHHSDYLSTK